MKQASHFRVSPNWRVLLHDMQIDSGDVLTYAGLPADLFNREGATLTVLDYFQLWQGVEKASRGRDLPLLLAQHMTVEAFDAPIFAALCSADLNTALRRIQQYKPLIGPLKLEIDSDEHHTAVVISCYGHSSNMPKMLELAELVFFTQLARLATRMPIVPLKVYVSRLPEDIQAYQQYFGCKLLKGPLPALWFAAEDARQPFLTANTSMWSYFDAGLSQRLADLQPSSSFIEKVRAVLIELLPAGLSSIDAVADKLALSRRTLQRKLEQESASYLSVLQQIRSDLFDHYLCRSTLSIGEIAFLLGYQDANSFIRFFTACHGNSPHAYRTGSCPA